MILQRTNNETTLKQWTLTLFHVGGVKVTPPNQFFVNNFFCINRVDLKLLDFLSYTYTHPIQF